MVARCHLGKLAFAVKSIIVFGTIWEIRTVVHSCVLGSEELWGIGMINVGLVGYAFLSVLPSRCQWIIARGAWCVCSIR